MDASREGIQRRHPPDGLIPSCVVVIHRPRGWGEFLCSARGVYLHPASASPKNVCAGRSAPGRGVRVSHDRDRCQHHHNQISKRPSATSAEYQLPTGLVDTQAARLDTPRPRSNFGSLNFLSFENRRASRLAVLYFGLFVFGQLGILLAFIRYAFRSTWNQHVQAGIGSMVSTLIICSLVMCFGEYFFHRYLLHLQTVQFLRSLYASHLTHHKLTSIRFDPLGTVSSEYAIADRAHDDQSAFPPCLRACCSGLRRGCACLSWTHGHVPRSPPGAATSWQWRQPAGRRW